MQEAKWYVVHTYSTYEKKVKANIEKIVESRNMTDLIQEIRIPERQVIEHKKGNKVIKSEKLFPSYVIIKMIVTDESWFVVRNTKGVTGFVGSGSNPIALTESEVFAMGLESRVIDLDIEVGDTIRVISGPFDGCTGEVLDIDFHNQLLKVKINMLGRGTPTEIEFSKVAKI